MLRNAVSGLVVVAALACLAGCERTDARAARTRGPAAVRRIVSIAPNATEILYDIGAGDRLVGVCTFCVYPEAAKRLPRVGAVIDPNLELILSLRPDLLIERGTIDVVEAMCKSHGIAVYKDPTESIADIERAIGELGRLTGCQSRASEVAAAMRTQLEAVRKRVAGQPRPGVLLTISRAPDRLEGIYTAAKGSFLDELIEIAGGRNVFADQGVTYPVVSVEAILARQPEIIVEAMPETAVSAEREQEIRRLWTALGPLPAAAAGRIYILTDENATIPSPRITRIAAKLADIFHPEARP